MQGHDGMASSSWLDGLDPIREFNPLLQVVSGVYLAFFGSFVF
jgi:NADPH:quinone reductase